ncbi:MAG: hypothetical protein HN855_13080 [Anaerolineae bacterium]|jgi:hypothetical protein|nr:hypothetical protein [Anaerolineae bacterium]MBT7073229.1 hypothetical protein [Anaerolineae bacterium]MBT7326088.1 hypothetical protein [Anaerolineae bacterium]
MKKSFLQNKDKKISKIFVVTGFIFIVFFSIYFAISIALSKTAAYTENDLLFGIDTIRVIDDMTVFSADHYRTSVHPLYLLFINPWGVILKKIIGSKLLAALAINSFFGALGVGIAFLFFYTYGKTITNAALLSSFFGISASQVILSITPDTATLAICSLLGTYLLFLVSLKDQKNYLFLWILIGIFSLGVTTSNFAQTFICYTALVITQDSQKSVSKKVFSVLGYGLCVFMITFAFALFQKTIYPSAGLFYLPVSIQDEMKYSSLLIFKEPFTVLFHLVKHFFVVNIISPLPTVFTLSGTFRHSPSITFSTTAEFGFIWWTGLILWITLYTTSLVHIWKNKTNRTLQITFLICFGFNFVLHSFYGVGERGLIEYFLYTGNFTFLLVSILTNLPLEKKKYLVVLLIGLILLVGENNFLALREIYFIYR